ncbi:MAG: glycosyltransferase [Candidatus Omnitrophica bacterium]|nr:glycosyltransferase [Candidatus Omnitrophota bacterium]MCG2706409.1 glycosyltransferase [Candidatus Omnitrophota bacterium]
MNQRTPLISVVIPTLNSSQYLSQTLESLKRQTYPNVEIIIVDNYSKDNTPQIAEKFGATVYLAGPERAAQDNYGIHKAKGEFVYLTGSDMIIDSDYIEQAVDKCLEEGYDAIYASVLSKEGGGFWERVKALERLSFIGSNLIEAARFFKKSVFMQLGGFDENLVGVEEDFQHRLDTSGYKTGRINAREVHLHEATTLTEVFKKSYYYGKFMPNYLKKHPLRGSRQLFPVRPSYICNIKIFAREPIYLLGFVVYKLIQYSGGSLGLITGFIKGHKKLDSTHKFLYGERKAS